MVVNAVGSAVLPGNTRTATGRPAGSVSSPYSIWGRPFLPSREYPRAASGQQRPVTQDDDRSNRASRSGLAAPARWVRTSLDSMASWRPCSQSIESKLVRTHLAGAANPDRLALFDLSSSWVTGRCCPLAARGYSRDGKKGLPQIEYGLLTDPAGRPVAVRVFPGNTADPTAFTTIVEAVKDTFKLKDMVMVGDRGMITSARVQELRELGGFGWVTALRAPAIAALA